MNRKKILEKERALGNISQSKTGDAILRKNIYERRILTTKLSDLENEQKVWKSHHNHGVKEAKKEAREMAKTAGVVSFRRVAQVALAAQKLKNLVPKKIPIEGLKNAPEELETTTHDNELSNNRSKPFQRKACHPNIESTLNLPPLVRSRQSNFSLHWPEELNSLPSTLLARQRINAWTGRSVTSADAATVVQDVIQLPGCQRTTTMSPMLDKRFLDLKAVLVPMHPSEESEGEEERREKEEDYSSDDGIPTS